MPRITAKQWKRLVNRLMERENIPQKARVEEITEMGEKYGFYGLRGSPAGRISPEQDLERLKALSSRSTMGQFKTSPEAFPPMFKHEIDEKKALGQILEQGTEMPEEALRRVPIRQGAEAAALPEPLSREVTPMGRLRDMSRTTWQRNPDLLKPDTAVPAYDLLPFEEAKKKALEAPERFRMQAGHKTPTTVAKFGPEGEMTSLEKIHVKGLTPTIEKRSERVMNDILKGKKDFTQENISEVTRLTLEAEKVWKEQVGSGNSLSAQLWKMWFKADRQTKQRLKANPDFKSKDYFVASYVRWKKMPNSFKKSNPRESKFFDANVGKSTNELGMGVLGIPTIFNSQEEAR